MNSKLVLWLAILIFSIISVVGVTSALCSEDDQEVTDEVLSEASGESSDLEDSTADSEVIDDGISDNSNDGLIYGPYDLNIDSVSYYSDTDATGVSAAVSADTDGETDDSSLEEAITALTESVDTLNETMSAEETEETEETEEPAAEETDEYDPDAAFLELGQALLEEQERIIYTLWIIAGLIIGLALGGVICFILL